MRNALQSSPQSKGNFQDSGKLPQTGACVCGKGWRTVLWGHGPLWPPQRRSLAGHVLLREAMGRDALGAALPSRATVGQAGAFDPIVTTATTPSKVFVVIE